MSGQPGELRGYLLEENLRKDQIEIMKTIPYFVPIFIGIVGLVM